MRNTTRLSAYLADSQPPTSGEVRPGRGRSVVVQLAALQALTSIGCNYLWATGLAVEVAVLHNFIWHQKFTWSDRCGSSVTATGVRLIRFHLSNGAISLGGSLLLMRWLVGELGMPVLLANVLTIGACSLANFLATDRWVFPLPVQTVGKE